MQITNKMHYNISYVFYSQFSYQHVRAAIVAIFRMMMLLQGYKGTNLVVSPLLHNK